MRRGRFLTPYARGIVTGWLCFILGLIVADIWKGHLP